MIDIAVKYQASIFGNLADISPSPEVISKLLTLFRDKNLLPSTFQEISQFTLGPQLRLQLSSPNNEWVVNFLTHRIDIEKNPIEPKGENPGSIEEFTKEVSELFARILEEYRKKANRIALVTGGLLREMNDDKLTDIYYKLFKPIDFYQENLPFEWNSRCVGRVPFQIVSSIEQVNVVTTINRLRVNLVQLNTLVNLDRIEVSFDINTIHENQETRFDINSLNSFYLEATKLRSQILSNLEVLINA